MPAEDTTLIEHGALYAYDADTGKLRRRWLLPPNGDVYTTDRGSGGVYRLPAGADSLVALVPPGTCVFPNGITRNAEGSPGSTGSPLTGGA